MEAKRFLDIQAKSIDWSGIRWFSSNLTVSLRSKFNRTKHENQMERWKLTLKQSWRNFFFLKQELIISIFFLVNLITKITHHNEII